MPHGIDGLVERNVLLAAARALHANQELTSPGPRLPAITVSREPFAGGTTIAQLVAERLQFVLWDRDVLKSVAERVDAIESILARVDERVDSSVYDFVLSLLSGDAYSQDTYRINLTKVVGGIALNGAAVIVGRGGQFILHDQRVLRVRVVCPFEERVQRAMLRDGLSEQVATNRVKELDHAMRVFVRRQFNHDIENAHFYDLILNTGTLDAEHATDVIVEAYRAKFHRAPITVLPPSPDFHERHPHSVRSSHLPAVAQQPR